MIKGLIFGLMMVLLVGCTETRQDKGACLVELTIENAYNQKIVLENIPPAGEPVKLLDSALIKDRVEKHGFLISDQEENLYRLHSADYRVDIVFINDAPSLKIKADYFNGSQFDFINSPSSLSLHNFLQLIKDKMQRSRKQDSSTQEKIFSANGIPEEVQTDYRNYVDTVTSPAAALYVYNGVDFGEYRKALKEYILKLGKRFPNHSAIQKLVLDTRNYLSIFEEELKVGEAAPDLMLPDITGVLFPLSFYKGKYLLVDFWASWDGPSRLQGMYKKKAFQKFGNKNFSLVSISLDPEREMWKQAIKQDGYNWPQLIDEKAWMGPAVLAFKFDSLPFNFLIDPDGRIIDKALYGDSLLVKLNQLFR